MDKEKAIGEELSKVFSAKVLQGGAYTGGEITIREGKALPVHEPERVCISGTIDAPARWLERRVDTLNQKACHVVVDRDAMTITLQCDENNYYGTQICGKLTISPEFELFGINKGEYKTHFELAELIKMNRTYFENRSVAMKLVTELQNFKAKVDKEIEQSDNNRGDRRILLHQAVQHNLPEAFTLFLPIFKSTPTQSIQVEVYVNPADLTCTLVSPEANDFIAERRDDLINDVITRICGSAPDVVIIEK